MVHIACDLLQGRQKSRPATRFSVLKGSYEVSLKLDFRVSGLGFRLRV